ncbi:hypothetical protein JMUB4039_1827 [Leptotrichia trevisanii]|jgi:hypothetical protein|uniref:Uncharacterized protein n=1 Tax=Leptotrichia trevisanii TaxID=109328 RepID=A0A510KMZ8_9FUSO|nr:hypothetical protein [Leptotrichia trevisanii]BBM45844.1 hypothetical protein JMUB3870_1964 [Leptotrichia trevisanii]BBM53056.1 hypothetical protein JMUB3935_2036 [Leptotrichia trevisanii]BBM57847.1 hypothetical protein JMUB4039_1827 [Leptotrichia trevisanii]
MSEKNFNNNEDFKNATEEKDGKVYTLESPIEEDKGISRDRKYINLTDKTKHLDLSVYNELDDFAAEVLDTDTLLKYVEARREYLFEPEETVKKYFGEEFLSDENSENKIATFSDFYYQYLIKYSDSYLYDFMAKGYTDGFRALLTGKGIDPDELNVDWESIRSKELEYDESLVDILYSIVNYELEHRGYAIFGINMGYESTLYFILPEKAFLRIDNEPQLFTIFDIGFLETIYNEIYEVVGNIGTENVRIGDFLEKRGNEYYTLFADASKNVVIENIDENDESKVKIIL